MCSFVSKLMYEIQQYAWKSKRVLNDVRRLSQLHIRARLLLDVDSRALKTQTKSVSGIGNSQNIRARNDGYKTNKK